MKIRLATIGLALGFGLLAGGPLAAENESRNWVRFQTWGVDSLELFASYYPAEPSELPVALMLHDRGGEGSDLAGLATAFARSGIPVFLPDMRGEGKSIVSRAGPVGPAPRWGAAELPLLRDDLESVYDFAAAQATLRERGWVVIAVGEAAGVGLAMAKSDPRLLGLILLSPLGLDRQFDFDAIEVPVYLLACDEDVESAELVRGLYGSLPTDGRRMDIMSCRSRGHRMLRWVGDLSERLADWAYQFEGETP